MSQATDPSTAALAAAVTRKPGSTWQRFLRNPLAVGSAVILSFIIISCAAAPLFGVPSPTQSSFDAILAPVGTPGHLLGGDSAGRDVLSRLLWGGQVSISGAALALGVAMIVGIPAGLIAAYYGGWFDSVTSWMNNLNMALPGIVILLAVRAVLGPSIWISMIVFGVMLAPGLFRVVRSSVQNVRNELYIDAARVSGLSDARIIGRHVAAVVRAPIIIQAALIAGIAIGIQAGLEFLGIGDNNLPSWGNMLNEGFRLIHHQPILLLWPSVSIGLTCAALAILGNGLRDALEDRGNSIVHRPQKPGGAAGSAEAITPTTTPIVPGALLQVSRLMVGYQQTDGPDTIVVKNSSLTVMPGEVVGLVGESGSGKSQTAFSILGLLPIGGRVVSGSILYDGKELTTLPRSERAALRGRDIAYIPQEPMSNLDPTYTIGHQLVAPMRHLLGLSKTNAKERAIALLRRVGIPNPERTFNAYPHEISGGMAQRVLIAGAVSCKPKILIADEPTTALDVTVQAEVLQLLRELKDELGMSIVLVTHNFGVVADICDRVAVMQSGSVVESGDVRNLFAAPQHEYTQRLLNSMIKEGVYREELSPTEAAR